MLLQDFAEEQNLVARMVHQLRSDDPDDHFQILKTARQHFSSGGPRRVRHTLPPLAFSALQVSLLFSHVCVLARDEILHLMLLLWGPVMWLLHFVVQSALQQACLNKDSPFLRGLEAIG